jgi:hypothetical protein
LKEGLDLNTNNDVLAELDAVLLEVERRLISYASLGSEFVDTADEGLALALKVEARLEQTQSASYLAKRTLKSVGIGEWAPSAAGGSFRDDFRLVS